RRRLVPARESLRPLGRTPNVGEGREQRAVEVLDSHPKDRACLPCRSQRLAAVVVAVCVGRAVERLARGLELLATRRGRVAPARSAREGAAGGAGHVGLLCGGSAPSRAASSPSVVAAGTTGSSRKSRRALVGAAPP